MKIHSCYDVSVIISSMQSRISRCTEKPMLKGKGNTQGRYCFQQRKVAGSKASAKTLELSAMEQLGRALRLRVPGTSCFLFGRAMVQRPLSTPGHLTHHALPLQWKTRTALVGKSGEEEGKTFLLPGTFVFTFLGRRTQPMCGSRQRSASELW